MPSGTMTGPYSSYPGNADSLAHDPRGEGDPQSSGGRKWKQMAVGLTAGQ